jgi:hypothetical protein
MSAYDPKRTSATQAKGTAPSRTRFQVAEGGSACQAWLRYCFPWEPAVSASMTRLKLKLPGFSTPWTPTAEALGRLIIVVGRNDPVRDVDDALETVKGFKVRIYIQAEKELMTQSRHAVLRKPPRGDHSLGRCGLLSSISARMARSCNRSTVSVSI